MSPNNIPVIMPAIIIFFCISKRRSSTLFLFIYHIFNVVYRYLYEYFKHLIKARVLRGSFSNSRISGCRLFTLNFVILWFTYNINICLMAYDIEHSASIGDILQGYVHYDIFEWPVIELEMHQSYQMRYFQSSLEKLMLTIIWQQ